jgi:hypothetical protein
MAVMRLTHTCGMAHPMWEKLEAARGCEPSPAALPSQKTRQRKRSSLTRLYGNA